MNNFIYYTPTKVFFGKKEEEKVGSIISEYGYKKVLLHYGKSSIKTSGLYDRVVSSLKEANLEVYELGGVEANPKIGLVRDGVKLVKENGVDFILAVGGGSVIDSAKAISNGAKVDFDPWLFSIKEQTPKDHVPLGTILTLSASGSAMSDSCVITNPEVGLKRGFNSPHNRPLFSILNPELTYTVDKYQTACGIVDSMMHTLERYLTKPGSFEVSDNIALAILKTIKNNAMLAYNEPYNYEARSNIMWAESLSHNSLTGCGNSFVMLVHQLEHELSGKFDRIAHAAGLSALFCGYLKYIYRENIDKICELGYTLYNIERTQENYDEKERVALQTIEEFKKFFASIGMPTSLSELEVYEDSFVEMANKLSKNKTVVLKGIIDLDYNAMIDIFELSK